MSYNTNVYHRLINVLHWTQAIVHWYNVNAIGHISCDDSKHIYIYKLHYLQRREQERWNEVSAEGFACKSRKRPGHAASEGGKEEFRLATAHSGMLTGTASAEGR